jgi:hypothetical protein
MRSHKLWLRSEWQAGATAHGPGGEVLATEAADFAADQDLGTARDVVTEAGGGPRARAGFLLRARRERPCDGRRRT